MKKYNLSICIPTWNRSKFLRASLEKIKEEWSENLSENIELIVSDNCSTDDTYDVVKSAIDGGLPVIYSRNSVNIGADGNFIKCINIANGNYILLLGDDDILLPGALDKLVEITSSNKYGLIHIHKYKNLKKRENIYTDIDQLFSQISFWITFMSSNIFLKETLNIVVQPDQYLKTNLLQVPFYIQSASLRRENIIISEPLLGECLDTDNNGGFNVYNVFLRNYLSIWNSFLEKNIISKSCYNLIKKDLLHNLLQDYNWRVLILRNGVAKRRTDGKEFRGGYLIDDAWSLLFAYYGRDYYFYADLLIMPFRQTAFKIKSYVNKKLR